MKWYSVLNKQAHATYFEASKVALLSCVKNTQLEPNLIYDGPADDFTEWFQQHGGKVHFAQVPFLEALERRKGVLGLNPNAARGAYLRLVIPEVENDDKWVIYTDVDVVFKHDPTPLLSGIRPKYLAATAEADPDDESFFNSGVMVLNVKNLKKQQKKLYQFVERNLPFWFGFSCNDQGALNYFFRGMWDPLPDELNWKSYWPLNPGAEIIHYHGNRPFETVARIVRGVSESEPSATRRRIFGNPEIVANMSENLLLYFSFFPLAGDGKSTIQNAKISSERLTFDLCIESDMRCYRHFPFDILLEDKLLYRDCVNLSGPRRTDRVSVELDQMDAIPLGSVLTIRGNPMTYVKAIVAYSDTNAARKKRQSSILEITSRGTRVAEYPPSPLGARTWTLPKTSWSVFHNGTKWVRRDEYEDVIKIRNAHGKIDIVQSINEVLGIENRCQNRLDGTSFRLLKTAVVAVQVENQSIAEQIVSFVSQIEAFRRYFGTGVAVDLIYDPTPLETYLLKRLKCEYRVLGQESLKIAVGKCFSCSGNGLNFHTSSPLADIALRRSHARNRKPKADSQVLVLTNDWEASALRRIVDDSLKSRLEVQVPDTENGESLAAIASSRLLLLEDESLAGYVMLARPDACVIHLCTTESKRGGVEKAACFRNFLYSRIHLPENDELSDSNALLLARKSIGKSIERFVRFKSRAS